MVKSELVQKLCNMHPNVLRKDVEKILEIIIFEMTETLYRNESVEIRGFGSLSLRPRSSRIGRNPKTGTSIVINKKYHPYFRASKSLKRKLNS